MASTSTSASATASASGLPYPPLRPHDTPDNHGSSITIAAAFCMTLTLLCLLARVSVRWPPQTRFKYDDWITVAATLFATIQAIITLLAVRDGLGAKALPGSHVNEQLVLKLIYTGSLFFVVSLALGKLALSFLCHRLAASDKQKRLCEILSYSIALWGLGSLIAIALRRDLNRPWDVDSLFVDGTLTRWIVIEVLGAIFEICFIVSIILLLQDMQMKRSRKATVLFSFSLRISVIGVAVVRLVYLAQTVSARTKYATFAATNPEIFTQLEMHVNVITATLPCLHVFMKSFESGNFGALSTTNVYYSQRSTIQNPDSMSGPQENGALRVNVNKAFRLNHMERSGTNSAVMRARGDDGASDGSENALYGSNDRIQRAYHPRWQQSLTTDVTRPSTE